MSWYKGSPKSTLKITKKLIEKYYFFKTSKPKWLPWEIKLLYLFVNNMNSSFFSYIRLQTTRRRWTFTLWDVSHSSKATGKISAPMPHSSSASCWEIWKPTNGMLFLLHMSAMVSILFFTLFRSVGYVWVKLYRF